MAIPKSMFLNLLFPKLTFPKLTFPNKINFRAGLNCACVIVTSCKCCAIASYINYARTLITHVHFSDPIILYYIIIDL